MYNKDILAMAVRTIKYLTVIILSSLTFRLCWVTVERWKLPYENGRYFDETTVTVFKEQSIFFYFLLTIITITLTTILTINIIKARDRKNTINTNK